MPLEIYKRGRWWHCRGTILGKRIRKSLRVGDRALAEHAANQIESKVLKEGVLGKEATATFADACIQYFADHPVQGPSQMSRRLAPIIKEIGDVRLRDISPASVRSLAIRLYPHYRPQSRNAACITPISAVMRSAHQHGLCGPISIKRFPVRDERIARPIDRAWLDAFMKHADPRVAAFALFCFTTGSRNQEACNLRPEHLHLDDGVAIGDATKNGKRRVYELVPEMVARLRVLPPRQVKQGPHKGEWRVFGYQSQISLLGPWRKACQDAGIEYRTKYEAGRHSHFTEVVVKHKVDVVTAGKLGNCTPAVLLRRYAHADAPAKAAMEVFGTKSTQQKRRKLKTVGET